jgi:hypothetical protein
MSEGRQRFEEATTGQNSSLYDALFPLSVSSALEESRATAHLDRLKLKTDRQRQALKSLKLPGCNRRLQQKFERTVLAHLALIRDVPSRSAPQKGKPQIPIIALPNGPRSCPAVIVREIRRASSQATRMIDRLEKQSAILRDFGGFFLPDAPIKELQSYAERLSAQADRLTIEKHRPRHSEHPQTRHIVELIKFVQEMTSARHWADLAILFREACNDQFINEDRLRKLCDYRRGRSRRGLRAIARQAGRPTREFAEQHEGDVDEVGRRARLTSQYMKRQESRTETD